MAAIPPHDTIFPWIIPTCSAHDCCRTATVPLSQGPRWSPFLFLWSRLLRKRWRWRRMAHCFGDYVETYRGWPVASSNLRRGPVRPLNPFRGWNPARSCCLCRTSDDEAVRCVFPPPESQPCLVALLESTRVPVRHRLPGNWSMAQYRLCGGIGIFFSLMVCEVFFNSRSLGPETTTKGS